MIYNFSSGPSFIPISVKEKMCDAMTNYKNSGMGIMEISHRDDAFGEVMNECFHLVRKLMNVPDDYEILITAGGATQHFSLIPMNLKVQNKKSLYALTGHWSEKAYHHAKKIAAAEVLNDSNDCDYTYIPDIHIAAGIDADYIHITSNNTIVGTQYHQFPDTHDIPLVADMTSDIMSRKINVSKFGMIYASTQKNLGVAGLTLSIIRKDLLERSPESLSDIFSFKKIAEHKSLFNTPPTLNIYILKLMLDWIQEKGGPEKLEMINQNKADLLYRIIDQSPVFTNNIHKEHRSVMNVPFTSGDAAKDLSFIKDAAANGLMHLKGHRISGGIRAAIYNAMPIEGVEKLAKLISKYQ